MGDADWSVRLAVGWGKVFCLTTGKWFGSVCIKRFINK